MRWKRKIESKPFTGTDNKYTLPNLRNTIISRVQHADIETIINTLLFIDLLNDFLQ